MTKSDIVNEVAKATGLTKRMQPAPLMLLSSVSSRLFQRERKFR